MSGKPPGVAGQCQDKTFCSANSVHICSFVKKIDSAQEAICKVFSQAILNKEKVRPILGRTGKKLVCKLEAS
jgi:hypothetical protein